MSDRREYLKNYRLTHKEKYREYQAKYRKQHLSTYEKLQQENAELKTKIKKYEDPEDLTLMFMYCDEKARDKIKELKAKLELYENGVYYSSENDKLSKEVDMWFSKYKEIIGDVEDE